MVRSDFRKAEKTVDVTVGESVRIIGELQGLSQNELSERSGIAQSTISAIENDRVNLGVGEEFVQIGGLYAGSGSELGEFLHHLQELLADLRGVQPHGDLDSQPLR